MRVLVELLRYLILAVVGFSVVLFVMIGIYLTDQGLWGTSEGFVWMIGIVATAIFLVLSFGFVAILFSIHDRHIELVRETERLADWVEAIASRQSND